MERSVREITNPDIPNIIGYFLGLQGPDLDRMGIDPEKLPEQQDWEMMFLADFHKSVKDKQFYYLIWENLGVPVGHANLNKIVFREQAFMHLHMWDAANRRSGGGAFFIRECITRFFRVFQLERILCEPRAENSAPNKILENAGFELVKTYETVPGWINFRQTVNQWEMTKERWDRLSRS